MTCPSFYSLCIKKGEIMIEERPRIPWRRGCPWGCLANFAFSACVIFATRMNCRGLRGHKWKYESLTSLLFAASLVKYLWEHFEGRPWRLIFATNSRAKVACRRLIAFNVKVGGVQVNTTGIPRSRSLI